jgi:hypothetical protein
LPDKKDVERKINYYFGYSFIWGFGLSYKQSAMKYIDNMMRDYFTKLHVPTSETVYEYYYNEKEGKVAQWEKIVPAFEYDPKLPFF